MRRIRERPGYIFISRFLPACEARGVLEGVLAAYLTSLFRPVRLSCPRRMRALRSESEDNTV
jgi:hypothetical protein